MSEKLDYDDSANPNKPTFPMIVGVASVIWLLVGILAILYVIVLGVAEVMIGGQNQAQNKSSPAFGFIFFLAFGIGFSHVAIQTFRGKLKSTRQNGIGSIIIGAIGVFVGLALLVIGLSFQGNAAPKAGAAPMLLFMGIIMCAIGSFVGLALVLAGILAVSGNTRYVEWRREREAEMDRKNLLRPESSTPPTDPMDDN